MTFHWRKRVIGVSKSEDQLGDCCDNANRLHHRPIPCLQWPGTLIQNTQSTQVLAMDLGSKKKENTVARSSRIIASAKPECSDNILSFLLFLGFFLRVVLCSATGRSPAVKSRDKLRYHPIRRMESVHDAEQNCEESYPLEISHQSQIQIL